MSHVRTIVRIGLAFLMVVAGIAHFSSSRPFVEHIPPIVPLREEIVVLTGAAEIVLAAGLLGPRRFRRGAGVALAAYLVLVLPGNVYAAVSQVPIDGLPSGWIRWARLPLQIPLIAAALWSTREHK